MAIPPEHRLLASARQAGPLCGVSLRTWWRWHSAALIPAPVVINGRPFWRLPELRAWIEAGCPNRHTWETLHRAKGDRL